MTTQTVGQRAAERLIYDKESIARAVTKRMFAEDPDILEKHGERGRQKCLEDMHYNIEHLIPAVDLEKAEMFADYARWLDKMLGSRGVSARDVRRCFEMVADETRDRFAFDEAALIDGIIRAGVNAVERQD
ncbi:MAG TPA: hypothetical protein VGM50_20060 [Gemmatimonadaceae bacterium]